MARSIDNTEDVIDSRDVIERIEYLTDIDEDEEMGEAYQLDEVERDELNALRKLAEQGEGLSDWAYGTTLILDDYFEDYAREFAEDIGAIDRDAQWPLMHIDWVAAAESLQMDYSSVDFGGVTYWARS